MSKHKYDQIVLDMPVANTQYPFQLPESVEKFRIKLRDTDVDLRVSHITGKVATSADPHWTLPSDSTWEEDDLYRPLTTQFYFATGNANQKLEIFWWTGIRRQS